MKTAQRFVSFLIATTSLPAQAYLGPGAGLGAFGTLLALLGAILLLIAGFLWYPIKRLLARRKASEKPEQLDSEE